MSTCPFKVGNRVILRDRANYLGAVIPGTVVALNEHDGDHGWVARVQWNNGLISPWHVNHLRPEKFPTKRSTTIKCSGGDTLIVASHPQNANLPSERNQAIVEICSDNVFDTAINMSPAQAERLAAALIEHARVARAKDAHNKANRKNKP